jgi:hypothetical protein
MPSPQKMSNSPNAERPWLAYVPPARGCPRPPASRNPRSNTSEWPRSKKPDVERGVSHPDVHRRSAIVHRQAAAEDRKLAELKRKESEADLADSGR